jgi:hypothetical protein
VIIGQKREARNWDSDEFKKVKKKMNSKFGLKMPAIATLNFMLPLRAPSRKRIFVLLEGK